MRIVLKTTANCRGVPEAGALLCLWKSVRPPDQRGISLLELLVVLGIMAILMVLIVAGAGMFQAPGLQRAAMTQLLATLEEARMTAIETGARTYVGFTDASEEDEERRLRGFILFREHSPAELELMVEPPEEGLYVPITRWQSLPRGFFYEIYDPGEEDGQNGPVSIIGDPEARMTVEGLPGGTSEVYAIGFGSLGGVVLPRTRSPRVAVLAGRMGADGEVVPMVGEDHAFVIHVARLTGRVTLRKP